MNLSINLLDIVIFFSKIGISAPQNTAASAPGSLIIPGQHCPMMARQSGDAGKSAEKQGE
jgi:hypothetical protein